MHNRMLDDRGHDIQSKYVTHDDDEDLALGMEEVNR